MKNEKGKMKKCYFFLDNRPGLCFCEKPLLGDNPGMGRRKMAKMKTSNNGFWFYYFYAPVCPLLRRM